MQSSDSFVRATEGRSWRKALTMAGQAGLRLFLPAARGTLATAQCATTWKPTDTGYGLEGGSSGGRVWLKFHAGSLMALLLVAGTQAQVPPLAPEVTPCSISPPNFVNGLGVFGAYDIALSPTSGLYVLSDLPGPNPVSRLDGTNFIPTSTVLNQGASVTRIVHWPSMNGMVIAGTFSSIDGTPVDNIAFLGNTASAWQPLSIGGPSMPIQDISVDSSNNLVVVGQLPAGSTSPRVARYSGASWQTVGSLNSTGFVQCVHAASPSSILVSVTNGLFQSTVEHWNGSAWTVLGVADGAVWSLLRHADGSVYASGPFTTMNGVSCHGISRWNGFSWLDIGGVQGENQGSDLHRMSAMSDGSILVSRAFFANTSSGPGAIVCHGIARFDPFSPSPGWSSISSLPDPSSVFNSGFWTAIEAGLNNRVVASRPFGVTLLSSTCTATITSIGTACGSPANLRTFFGTRLPWAGSTTTSVYFPAAANAIHVLCLGFNRTTLGLNSNSACEVYIDGFDPALISTTPLPNDVAIDPLYFQVFPNPVVLIPLQVPRGNHLLGLNIYEQVYAMDSAGNEYTSNALKLVVGGF